MSGSEGLSGCEAASQSRPRLNAQQCHPIEVVAPRRKSTLFSPEDDAHRISVEGRLLSSLDKDVALSARLLQEQLLSQCHQAQLMLPASHLERHAAVTLLSFHLDQEYMTCSSRHRKYLRTHARLHTRVNTRRCVHSWCVFRRCMHAWCVFENESVGLADLQICEHVSTHSESRVGVVLRMFACVWRRLQHDVCESCVRPSLTHTRMDTRTGQESERKQGARGSNDPTAS